MASLHRREIIGGLVAGVPLALASGFRAMAQTAPTFKVGFLSDLSGNGSDLSGAGSLTSLQLAVKDHGGSVLGRPIEIVVGNHLAKPEVGLTIAREWYDKGVHAIFDVGLSTVALAVQGLSKEKNRAVIFISSSSSDLTGRACSPTGIVWTYDNYSQAQGVIRQMFQEQAKTWFFITIDYVFGHNVQRDTRKVVEEAGGRVIGSVLHPYEATDYAAYLLAAQASKADVIALATTTHCASDLIKQADEFGLRRAGQKVAPLSLTLHDVKALGPQTAQGLIVTEPYYWDQNAGTRTFAERYFKIMNKMPNSIQASAYGAMIHYLKCVEAANTADTATVVAAMKRTPVNDFMTTNGSIRQDGRTLRDDFVFRVKSPAQSKSEWDLYEQVSVIPADRAFQPPDPLLCSLVKS